MISPWGKGCMSKAVILQHAPHLGPGRIAPVFRDFGIPVDVRRLDQGDEIPTDLEEIRLLVVLHAPVRITEIEADQAAYVQAELNLLRRMVEFDRPVLGINYGAQLLAHAAGAKVYPNAKPGPSPDQPGEPMPEYGWEPIRLPFPGGTEPIVMGLMDEVRMFQWHVDTFDLPKVPPPANPAPPPAPPPPTGNSLLCSSIRCRNQAFRFKTRLFGFQFHLELTEEGIEQMLSAATDEERKHMTDQGIERIRQDTAQHYGRYDRLCTRVIRQFVQFLKTY
jgi:GMP synthase (glutamine-hydrolysing)